MWYWCLGVDYRTMAPDNTHRAILTRTFPLPHPEHSQIFLMEELVRRNCPGKNCPREFFRGVVRRNYPGRNCPVTPRRLHKWTKCSNIVHYLCKSQCIAIVKKKIPSEIAIPSNVTWNGRYEIVFKFEHGYIHISCKCDWPWHNPFLQNMILHPTWNNFF